MAAAAWAADYNTAVKQTPLMSWTGRSPAPELAGEDPVAVAKQVDRLLIEDVAAADTGTKVIQPSRRRERRGFLRRVYQDLIGRNPTPAEVTAFMLDPASDKRGKLVDRLLGRSALRRKLGPYWRDVIMYHRSDDRAQLASESLFEYLRDQFNKNTPWDQIARSFITATGDVRENGATGLIMAQNGNTADITSEVPRIFLGVQIQCANCHDHKTDRWKREQFHQLAAFFPRIRLLRRSPHSRPRRRPCHAAAESRRRDAKFDRLQHRPAISTAECQTSQSAGRQTRAFHARLETSGIARHEDAAGVFPDRPELDFGTTDEKRRDYDRHMDHRFHERMVRQSVREPHLGRAGRRRILRADRRYRARSHVQRRQNDRLPGPRIRR